MSLTSAMNAAMSGLNAVTRATELVSENIANAGTPGYARRSLALSAYGSGLIGVRVLGVVRHQDPVLIAHRRVAETRLAHDTIRADFHARLNTLTGAPGDAYGLTARFADFDASLIAAASRPDLTERLNDVAIQASELAGALVTASDGIQDQRRQADQAIDGMVDELNTNLARLQELNSQITRSLATGNGGAGLQDQRQQIIDDINRLVPVTVVERAHGQVALYTQGGAILIDGPAAELGFDGVTDVQPHLRVETGGLSGLTLNGVPVRTGSSNGALRGGALGAQFAIRDEWAVEAQADLDALARDLLERFDDPGLDPTRAPGQPGLFTDAGALFDPADEVGLAGRIALNSAVDPARGGESWRLRDGLGAAAPGEPGNPGLLGGYSDALSAARVPASGSFGPGALTAGGLVAALVSGVQQDWALAQDAQGYASATHAELARSEAEQGVDTDAELQSLLVLEQHYAANAKVMETIDQMLADLLRI